MNVMARMSPEWTMYGCSSVTATWSWQGDGLDLRDLLLDLPELVQADAPVGFAAGDEGRHRATLHEAANAKPWRLRQNTGSQKPFIRSSS